MKRLTIALIVLTMFGCTASDLLLGHDHKDKGISKPDSVIAIPISDCGKTGKILSYEYLINDYDLFCKWEE